MDMVAGMRAMTSLDLVALAAVVLIGLPHGALDGAIAMHLGYANKILNFISFIVLYVVMAGLVVALWIVMPAPCLLAFLIISMIHFGSGDASWYGLDAYGNHGPWWTCGHGISQMHRTEVDVVFGHLVGSDTGFVWRGLDVLTVFVGLALIVCIGQALWFRKWRWTAVEPRFWLPCLPWLRPCRLCGLFLPCAFSAPCCRDCRQPETLHVCCQFMRPDPGLHAGKLACRRGGRLVVCRHDKPRADGSAGDFHRPCGSHRAAHDPCRRVLPSVFEIP